MSRRCEVFIAGRWEPRPFAELEAGDTFRLFEADGAAVVDEQTGATRFLALTAARDDPEGRVKSEPLPETAVEREARARGTWWPEGRASAGGQGRLSPR